MTRNKVAAAIAGVLVVAGALAATQLPKHDAPPARPAIAANPGPTAIVEQRDVADVYAADAVIEAVRAATVSAQISGNVTRYYVDAGDRVKRGQVLVRIDTRETDAQVVAGNAAVASSHARRSSVASRNTAGPGSRGPVLPR